MDWKDVVGKITTTRTDRKIKQKDFAEMLGLSKDYVNKVENFHRIPSIKRVCEAFDCLGLELNVSVKNKSKKSKQAGKKS